MTTDFHSCPPPKPVAHTNTHMACVRLGMQQIPDLISLWRLARVVILGCSARMEPCLQKRWLAVQDQVDLSVLHLYIA